MKLNKLQLELAIQTVIKAYKPIDIDTDDKLATIISKEFKAVCTSEQIFIHRTSRCSDDFEREHRRIQYGYNYDTFVPNK